MSNEIAVLRQALEALETLVEMTGTDIYRDAKKALRQAIAEAEDNYQGSDAAKAAHMMDLYTALGVKWGEDPFAVIAKMRDPQPKVEPLTDEQIETMWQEYCKQWKTGEKIVIQFVDFARAIEAAHGIKGKA